LKQKTSQIKVISSSASALGNSESIVLITTTVAVETKPIQI